MYQRSKTQEESMGYDVFDQIRKKHDGSLPLVGVNAFLPKVGRRIATEIELIRREKCTWPHFCSNGRAFGTPLISRVRRRVHLY
jgi:methylmalonyl-CoA mutase